jgi:hypothetical protein
MPGKEDFEITMVEPLASGKPLIALAQGGALEIVRDGCGLLYPEPSESALGAALEKFASVQHTMRPSRMQLRASRFSESAFQTRFRSALSGVWTDSIPPPSRRHRNRFHNSFTSRERLSRPCNEEMKSDVDSPQERLFKNLFER